MNAAEPNTLKQQRRDSRVGGWEAQGLAEGVARYPEPLRPLPVWFTFVGCSRLPLVPERFVITEAALREAINQMVGQRTESPARARLGDTRARRRHKARRYYCCAERRRVGVRYRSSLEQ